MWWDEFYLTLTGITLYLTRKDDVAFNAAFSLLMWYVLANASYKYGEIESLATYVTMTVFVLFNLMTWLWHRRWLPLFLMAVGVLVCTWTYLYSGDAYGYKFGKNALYFLGVVVVCLYSIFYSRPES